MPKPKVVYCSWSRYKAEEWDALRHLDFHLGRSFDEVIEFEFRRVATEEPLLCDLSQMVHAKAISAYRKLRIPCIVEHAGLILDSQVRQHYPGGLTQPMWDALGAERFVASCTPLGTTACAQAVIGYCDGAGVYTFVGETRGTLIASSRGARSFYWDTVFCPDGYSGRTYAEIADNNLVDKLKIFQSIKALREFVNYRLSHSPILFPDF